MTNWRFPPQVDIDEGLLAKIEEHSYSTLEFEVGGMLIGEIKGRVTRVVGVIPALKASATQINLTFTHEVWEQILEEADSKFPDYSIVGWYHTHPGFGVFLSEYDRFIQDNFFNQKGQLALVVDPVSGNKGWFAHDSRRKVRKFSESPTQLGPRRKPEVPGTQASKFPLAKVFVASLLAFLFGGSVSWGILSSLQPPDVRPALLKARSDISALQAELSEARAANDLSAEENRAIELERKADQQEFNSVLADPVLIYTVREGETLESLAVRFYGDAGFGKSIAEANDVNGEAELAPGSVLLLPLVPGVSVSPDPWASDSFGAGEGEDQEAIPTVEADEDSE